MKHQVRVRLLCFLMAILWTFSCLPLSVAAQEAPALPDALTEAPASDAGLSVAEETGVTETILHEEAPLSYDELTVEQLKTATLPSADIPEVLPASVVAEKQLVNRVRSEENIYTLVFQGRNGGKTAYIYNTPIKYVAEDGTIHDRSTALTTGKYVLLGKQYVYAALDNSIKQYYPALVKNGVLVQMKGYNVEMVPLSTYVCLMESYEVEPTSQYYKDILAGDAQAFCSSCATKIAILALTYYIEG